MSIRADPERIDQARRQAMRSRLIGLGVPAGHADAWIEAWAGVNAERRAPDFWERGFSWVEGEVSAGRKPPAKGARS